MKTTENSINHNGCSVCKKGQEKYVKCVLGAFRGRTYYQYDYRHTDGELFSTLKPTLEQCREEKDKWLQLKNQKRLYSTILKKIEENKRLTKSEMAYQITAVNPHHSVAISWDFFSREEVVTTFNQIFGTEIQ